MGATDRIKVTAQLHTTNVFSGHIPDEISGDELLTYTNIRAVTVQRFRVTRPLMGNGTLELAIDNQEWDISADDYRLYDILQNGLQSTNGVPYTFIWLVPERFEPFFPEAGKYYVVFRFYPRDENGTILKLSFEVTAG
jgi:hypothetical protein